ncbi:LysM peptidoglycan-binding domain-containing protein [Pseudarthrobacter sp. N5]|uniref:LysM peptidoglycan-binding domain-containing protein n=1 Tax=Pseudarthrobacter sp. N5 TaxID=3418416 RepID=UPI003CECCEF7
MQTLHPRPLRSDAAMAAVILSLGIFLAVTGAVLMDRWRVSAARQQSLSFEDLLGMAANTVGLVMVAWWVLSLLIALAAAVLERAGSRRAADATGRFSPAFMRRLALAALGIQLISAPMANAAAITPGWGPTQEMAYSAAWAPTSGQQPIGSQQAAEASAAALPTRRLPALPTATPTGDTQPLRSVAPEPQWKPGPSAPEPGLVIARPIRTGQEATGENFGSVTVLAGDSLWSIAARELGPAASDVDIALYWPRWYQANQDAIGQNPDVLLPGQILKSPSAA